MEGPESWRSRPPGGATPVPPTSRSTRWAQGSPRSTITSRFSSRPSRRSGVEGQGEAGSGPVESDQPTGAGQGRVGRPGIVGREADVGRHGIGQGHVLVPPVGLDDAETLGDGGYHHGTAGFHGEGVEVPPRGGDTRAPRLPYPSRTVEVPGHEPPAVALGDEHPVTR